MRGEFVLCQGDLVSNVRLVDMIEKHRERCSKDKNGIMTKLLMHGGEGDSTRSKLVLGFIGMSQTRTVSSDQVLQSEKKSTLRPINWVVVYHEKLPPYQSHYLIEASPYIRYIIKSTLNKRSYN